MNATITLEGPVRYGNTAFELQATIICENGEKHCKQWSIHAHLQDAIEYKDRFNTQHPSPPKELAP